MFDRRDPAQAPNPEELAGYIKTPLWEEFCGYMEETYGVRPRVEFSKCGMEYGWNAKFKKGSRALCTVYPREGWFTVMVVVGRREKPAVEAALPAFTPEIRQLYQDTTEGNGQKWLMIDLEDRDERYEDAKRIIGLRVS